MELVVVFLSYIVHIQLCCQIAIDLTHFNPSIHHKYPRFAKSVSSPSICQTYGIVGKCADIQGPRDQMLPIEIVIACASFDTLILFFRVNIEN